MSLAQIKRFLDSLHEPRFARKARSDIKQALEELAITLPLEEALYLVHNPLCHEEKAPPPPLVSAYLQWQAKRQEQILHEQRVAQSTHTRYQAWRQRQINRLRYEIGSVKSSLLPPAPCCFELSQGCSVGCWFCGVDARSFQGYWPYTKENSRLWKESLQVLCDLLGSSAVGRSFCYWATEPFDNPDYERFVEDFYSLTSYWPRTTTALALREVERTRRFLQRSRECAAQEIRFSIHSPRDLQELYRYFDAEELLHVDLTLQFRPDNKSLSGRARKQALRQSTVQNHNEDNTSTIACLVGFLISFPLQSIELVAPCPACNTWPEGYKVLEKAFFNTSQDLKIQVQKMIEMHMPSSLPLEIPLRFPSSFQLSFEKENFILETQHMRFTCQHILHAQSLGKQLEKACFSAREIAEQRHAQYGLDPLLTYGDLSVLYTKGVISPCQQIF